jgi:bifunctional UDP-N-acetylglucosamine pyrophosphorylase/glucosamine-1-phosphate N-acetyltransferase
MSTNAINIVILAAGKGTRMHSDLPKVLHPLAGQPLLQHVLTTARALSPSRLCVVYGYGGELVPQRIAADDVTWVLQAEQHGTGHAVQQAQPRLEREAVALVLLGDVPLIERETCEAVLAAAAQGQLALLTMEKPDPSGYGRILRDEGGRICAIVEHKDASEAQRRVREVNTGIMAMPVALLSGWLARLNNDNQQREYYLTDIVAMAVEDGIPVGSVSVRHEHDALGVNSKADLAQAERIYQVRMGARLLAAGVTLADPARLDVRGQLACGRDVVIDINCIFEGEVALGDGVEVGAHCILRDVTVAAGTRIAPYSHLDGASIGSDCRIGPFARIRPGTRLGTGVHVGNFVELKNSVVEQASKINHLSYVGDSQVGRDVNIGAGTITCNYDGANKHRTVIGDGAFIGSDSQLVAPVAIGEGATIGAGSTITKDAPAGALTLSRGRQVTIPGWKRPIKLAKPSS